MEKQALKLQQADHAALSASAAQAWRPIKLWSLRDMNRFTNLETCKLHKHEATLSFEEFDVFVYIKSKSGIQRHVLSVLVE